MGTTKAEDNDDDYMSDDKNEDYDEEYDADTSSDSRASSPDSGSTTTEEPYIIKEFVKKGDVGKTVVMKCHGENLDDTSIYMWYNGSQLLYQGKGFNQAADVSRLSISLKEGTMTIKNVNPYDDGNYRCRAYAKKRFETLIDFQVDGPPSAMTIIEHKAKNVEVAGTTVKVHAGKKDLEFKCSVGKSRPAAKFNWIHNGNTILESQGKDHDLKIEDENVLIIKNVHARHAGEYQCEASNEIGTLKSTFNIEVKCE